MNQKGKQMDDEDFDADLYVKSMKEQLTEDVCKTPHCLGMVSEWDRATRDGICSECFWGRGPVF